MVGEQRCAISARIIGVMHRDAPKLKVFMISVLWSDESEVIVYRSFQDFKKFHRQLKKRFPLANPLRRRDRVIPKFRGKAMKQKGSSKSVRRMRFLDDYCSKLLRCDLTVTQSSEVTQFFMPKDQDLQPDFTKNSVMILLSDDVPEGQGGGGGDATRQHAGSVTHPFVTQTYRCVASHETKDTKNRPFKVSLDEKLDVLIKDPAGWWLVENEDKRLAWFPAPYLEMCEEEEEGDDNGFILGGALYCAVRSYLTKKDDEVSVAIGSVVEVLRKSDNGWWLIRYNGKAGYVPSMYLQPYNNPRAGLYSLQRKLHCSTLNLATNSSTHGSSFDLSLREPQTRSSYPASINEENSPQQDSPVRSRGETNMPLRLHKARSLDALSEAWSHAALPAPRQRDVSVSDSRKSSVSDMSSESELSGFSSGSESSSSCKEQEQLRSRPGRPAASPQSSISGSGRSSPDLSLSNQPSSSSGSGSSSSVRYKGSERASVAPSVPPRPKAQEILTRCTTMTRKAALASRARLLPQPQPIHSR
ncbi:NADPH oxidase organizer 1b [Centroberyx affinis]|uniref:NADPH oxidase organizer 1b n=1 Tax=Centroberyx affinis TaxID=166261 RepID=UPI003A5C4ADD